MKKGVFVNRFHILALFFVLLINCKHIQAEEDGDDKNSTVISCFSCDGGDECSEDQVEGNSTAVECDEGQHCWIKSNEADGTEVYKRYCGDSCSEQSRETDCKTSGNDTECALCCSENFCNDGSVNGANRPGAQGGLLTVSLLWTASILILTEFKLF